MRETVIRVSWKFLFFIDSKVFFHFVTVPTSLWTSLKKRKREVSFFFRKFLNRSPSPVMMVDNSYPTIPEIQLVPYTLPVTNTCLFSNPPASPIIVFVFFFFTSTAWNFDFQMIRRFLDEIRSLRILMEKWASALVKQNIWRLFSDGHA